jgi:hypothetical protein
MRSGVPILRFGDAKARFELVAVGIDGLGQIAQIVLGGGDQEDLGGYARTAENTLRLILP